jgi:hypothetical protein
MKELKDMSLDVDLNTAYYELLSFNKSFMNENLK